MKLKSLNYVLPIILIIVAIITHDISYLFFAIPYSLILLGALASSKKDNNLKDKKNKK